MKKLIVFGSVIILTFVLSGCTWLDDSKKDFESDTKGLERTVTIYSKTGKVLSKYKGENVRTKYKEGGTQIIVNVDGKRVQAINADVVIEEKGADKYKVGTHATD